MWVCYEKVHWSQKSGFSVKYKGVVYGTMCQNHRSIYLPFFTCYYYFAKVLQSMLLSLFACLFVYSITYCKSTARIVMDFLEIIRTIA